MNRTMLIFLILYCAIVVFSQEEKCKTCVVYDPTTVSQRLGDMYPQLNKTMFKDARVTILPDDLIVLAGTNEVTVKTFDETKKKIKSKSVDNFSVLEGLIFNSLLVDKAEEWNEKNKVKIKPDVLLSTFLSFLTSKVTANDTEGKAYYNLHKTEYSGKKYENVAKEIKKKVLLNKMEDFIRKYKVNLVKSTYIEINQNWLVKNIK